MAKLKELISIAQSLSKSLEYPEQLDDDAACAKIILNNPKPSNPEVENLHAVLTVCAEVTLKPALWADKFTSIGKLNNSSLFESNSDNYEKFIAAAKNYIKEKKPAIQPKPIPAKALPITVNTTATVSMDGKTSAQTPKPQLQLPRLPDIKEILAKRNSMVSGKPRDEAKVAPPKVEFLATQQRITQRKEPIALPQPKPNDGALELLKSQLEMEKKKYLSAEAKLAEGNKVLISLHEQLKAKSAEAYNLERTVNELKDAEEKNELALRQQYFLYDREEDGNIPSSELDKLLNQIYAKFAEDVDFNILKDQIIRALPDDKEGERAKDFVSRLHNEYKEMNHDILFSTTVIENSKKLWQNSDPQATKSIELLDAELDKRIEIALTPGSSSNLITDKVCVPFFKSVRNRIANLKSDSELNQIKKHPLYKFIKRNMPTILPRAANQYKEARQKVSQPDAKSSSFGQETSKLTLFSAANTTVNYVTATAAALYQWGRGLTHK